MPDTPKDSPVTGLKAWYITMIVLGAIGTIGSATLLGTLAGLIGIDFPNMILAAFIFSFIHFAYFVLYIISLAGLAKRKPFSVPWGRAALIITLLWIPVGTIAGGLMLRKINSPEVKKYLNYRN